MPVLFFWTREFYEADMYGPGSITECFYSPHKTLHRAKPDDTVWAFTRNSADVYVLAARLEVERRIGPFEGTTRPYGVVGKPGVAYFRTSPGASSVEDMVRNELGVRARRHPLGMSFEGPNHVRRLPDFAQSVLEDFVERHRLPEQ